MVKKLEMKGIFIIFLLSFILHNLYTWTDIEVFGLFSPINESIWEHMKMIWFAALFYSIFEYFMGLNKEKNFIFAKAISLLLMIFLVPAIFYTYTAFTEESILIIDILIAFIAILLGQLLSYKIITSENDYSKYNWIGLSIIIVMSFLFFYFTYYPPNAKIFIPND